MRIPEQKRYTGKTWAGLALVALAGACAAPTTPLSGSISPAPSSPPVVAVSPMPSPASVFTPKPVSQIGFSCQLPFLRPLGAGHWQAGFLSLPSGNFAADETAPQPSGYYDRAVSKWLTVGRNAVAPDGLHYALTTGGFPAQTPGPPRLHIVVAATGVERVIDLALPHNQPYGVEDYAADGIYVGSSWEGGVIGRWRVDPASGQALALGRGDLLLDDGTGHAWRVIFDPRDPKPARGALDGNPMPNEVVRRDLTTGADEGWFFRPGFSVSIAGTFLSGSLLVQAQPDVSDPNPTSEYWLVTSPGRSVFVAHLYGGPGMADGHGIWLGSPDGLYLFTPEGGFRRVSDVPGDPANGCL